MMIALSQATRRQTLAQATPSEQGQTQSHGATTSAPAPALAKTREIADSVVPARPHDRAHMLIRLERPGDPGLRDTRPLRRWTLLWLPSIACALLCADVVVRNRSLLRPDLLARFGELLPAALGVLLVAGLATLLATAPAAYGLSPRAAALRWGALCAGPLTTLPVLFLARDNASAAPPEHLHRWGFPCFFLAYVIAVFSLVVLARELRRPLPVMATWRGAALGSAAGSWSALALLLHCPGIELQHLLVGHVLPISLLPLIGLALARHCLRMA